ncbi:Imm44 family immunity protein [Desulforhopalus sp. 52FAK]
MKLFLSGEISDINIADKIPEKFNKAVGYIESRLKPFLASRDYGEEVNELNIIPVIIKLPKEMESKGWFKERKLFKRKTKSSDFRLRIDYDKFCNGNDDLRINLVIKNIIDSVRILDQRTTKNFDGKKLENDILELFSLSINDLN